MGSQNEPKPDQQEREQRREGEGRPKLDLPLDGAHSAEDVKATGKEPGGPAQAVAGVPSDEKPKEDATPGVHEPLINTGEHAKPKSLLSDED